MTPRRAGRLALVPLVALALASLAPAGNAGWWVCNALLVEIGTGEAPTVYLVSDEDPAWMAYSYPWMYVESNGIPHLQRGGITILGDADPCGGPAPADFGVF